ncbi:MAG TPA: hypothetical protein VH866_09770 [Candidatus Deferrimicrobiaceae bacterium]|jgi:hypothetical protein
MKTRHLCILLSLLLAAAGAYGCASGQVRKSFNERTGEISAKIAEAERLGARNCDPRELARVKVELEHVRHEIKETHYPIDWMHLELDKAEKAANELLEKRRHAASLGIRFRCMEAGG